MTIHLKPNVILLGAGGHAKVVCAMAQALGYVVIGVCAPELGAKPWQGIEALPNDDAILDYDPTRVALLNGIGKLPGDNVRHRLLQFWQSKGFSFPALVHPAAWVAPGVAMAEGVQVMAGAIIQPGSSLGRGTIINTSASVDHDCQIGADVHVAPGATLCGSVSVGDGSFIGARAAVVQSIQIGRNCTIAAGAVLVRDVEDCKMSFGQTRPVLQTGGPVP